jgi:hypothetical protein
MTRVWQSSVVLISSHDSNPNSMLCYTPPTGSCTEDLFAGVILDLLDAVLFDHLDNHPLEVNRQSPLQLVGAHS